MNFVVLYCNKNQYEMFEEFFFKYSPVNFSDVDIMVFDDNASLEQKEKLKNLCKRYENITWINPDVCEDSKAPNLTCVKTCDEYLKKNNIDKKWILFFENDVFPFQEDFWQKLNTKIINNKFLENKVGSFGFSSYQDFKSGVNRNGGSPLMGRGNLVNEILNQPHSGWYKNLPDEYYESEYFVVEGVNWQSICINRKLFNECIDIDNRYDNRLLNFDDMSHQFLSKGFFNIVFPSLAIYHDSGELKQNIKLMIDNNYSRSNNSHSIFTDRWGWSWGYRNLLLREQFKSNLSFWSDKKDLYENSMQKKLFETKISDGPKTIEDFNE